MSKFSLGLEMIKTELHFRLYLPVTDTWLSEIFRGSGAALPPQRCTQAQNTHSLVPVLQCRMQSRWSDGGVMCCWQKQQVKKRQRIKKFHKENYYSKSRGGKMWSPPKQSKQQNLAPASLITEHNWGESLSAWAGNQELQQVFMTAHLHFCTSDIHSLTSWPRSSIVFGSVGLQFFCKRTLHFPGHIPANYCRCENSPLERVVVCQSISPYQGASFY